MGTQNGFSGLVGSEAKRKWLKLEDGALAAHGILWVNPAIKLLPVISQNKMSLKSKALGGEGQVAIVLNSVMDCEFKGCGRENGSWSPFLHSSLKG